MIVVASSLLVLAAAGCAKHPAMETAGSALPGGQNGMGYDAQRPDRNEYAPVAAMPDIHFAFDQYALRPEAKHALESSAMWLKARPQALLMIEGHCDERGTNEYNLSLGEKRAKASKDYLVSRGVDARRISVVSFGEEQPLCQEHGEACWTKNRRAHFLVKGE
jgi:peptidoglycan-associated lipoprotein